MRLVLMCLVLAAPAAAGGQSSPADCPSGDPGCIDRVVAELDRRLNVVVPVCDHRAVFALGYQRLTEDLRANVRAGRYDDPHWLARDTVAFANLYYRWYDAWASGQSSQVPPAWELAFGTAQRREAYGIVDFLLAVSAHINRDLPFVLAGIGLASPEGTSHKPDYDRVNDSLAAVQGPLAAELAARFDPTIDDLAVSPLTEASPEVFRRWRENAWRNAERLVAAPDAFARAAVAQSIEREAQAVGRGLLAGSPRAGAEQNARRAAWCAAHGGQRPAAYRPGPAAPRLARGRLPVAADGTARVLLACSPVGLGCRGQVAVLRAGRRLGRAGYALRAGERAAVRVRLSPTVARALRRGTGERVTIRVSRLGVRAVRTVVQVTARTRRA